MKQSGTNVISCVENGWAVGITSAKSVIIEDRAVHACDHRLKRCFVTADERFWSLRCLVERGLAVRSPAQDRPRPVDIPGRRTLVTKIPLLALLVRSLPRNLVLVARVRWATSGMCSSTSLICFELELKT